MESGDPDSNSRWEILRARSEVFTPWLFRQFQSRAKLSPMPVPLWRLRYEIWIGVAWSTETSVGSDLSRNAWGPIVGSGTNKRLRCVCNDCRGVSFWSAVTCHRFVMRQLAAAYSISSDSSLQSY